MQVQVTWAASPSPAGGGVTGSPGVSVYSNAESHCTLTMLLLPRLHLLHWRRLQLLLRRRMKKRLRLLLLQLLLHH